MQHLRAQALVCPCRSDFAAFSLIYRTAIRTYRHTSTAKVETINTKAWQLFSQENSGKFTFKKRISGRGIRVFSRRSPHSSAQLPQSMTTYKLIPGNGVCFVLPGLK